MVLALTLFLTLSLYQIELPGLHYDEAREAGVPAMQLHTHQAVETFRGSGIRLGDRQLPLMVTDYIGALNVYFVWPSLALFGISVSALRLVPVVFAALTLWLTYLLARRLFGWRAGALTVLLLAVNPSFVFWSRQGIFVTSITATIAMGALLCWLRWYRRRQPGYLYAGAFLFGLGLYAKLLFLWVIVALAATFVLFKIPDLVRGFRSWFRTGQYKHWIVALAFFLLGILPLLIYNAQTNGTIQTLTENLTSTYYGGSNLAFVENLLTRLEQFEVVLNGSHFWYLGGTFANKSYSSIFAGAGLLGLLVVVFMARHQWHKLAFPYLMLGLMLLASCFTVSALWFTHYSILVPFMPMAVVVPLDLVARHATRSASGPWIRGLDRIGQILLILVVGFLGAKDLQVDLNYHQALARSGGYAAHSDASYKLTRSLQERGISSPLAMDWGIDATVEFLSAGDVNPIEIFGYEWEAGEAFAARLAPFLTDPRNLYIFHSEEETVFQRRHAFEELVASAGRTSEVQEEIHDRSGRLMFILVRVE